MCSASVKGGVSFSVCANSSAEWTSPGRSTGAQIASRLSVVFLVFSVNAGKTKDIPKQVDQVPSGSEQSKSL